MKLTCYRCNTAWWQSGERSGHCTGCHRTFSSLTAFVRHQRMPENRTICLNPEEIGLVPRADKCGTVQWGCPNRENNHWRKLREEARSHAD